MERFLDGAPTWPSAVVIEGEAGVGKTTLWLESIRRAANGVWALSRRSRLRASRSCRTSRSRMRLREFGKIFAARRFVHLRG